jgi:hypothetical protein
VRTAASQPDPPPAPTVATAPAGEPPAPPPLAAKPEPKSKPKGVATPIGTRDLAKVIDLRTFPRMDGAEPEFTPQSPLVQAAYKAPGDVKAAIDFHLKALTDAGWEPHYPDGEEKGKVYKEGKSEFAMITVTRQAFVVSVHVNGEAGKNEVRVSIFSTGNFDTRTLPRMTDARSGDDPGTFPNYSHSMYTTAESIEAAEAFTRKAMAAAGWQEFSDRLSDNRRPKGSLNFRNRAVAVSVDISTAPALGNKTAVQYNASVLSAEVPTPADAADVRLEDRERFRMQFETGLSVQEVVDFYKKELPALGWTFREKAGEIKADTGFVSFDADTKDALSVDLKRQPKGKTLVKVTSVPPGKPN